MTAYKLFVIFHVIIYNNLNIIKQEYYSRYVYLDLRYKS